MSSINHCFGNLLTWCQDFHKQTMNQPTQREKKIQPYQSFVRYRCKVTWDGANSVQFLCRTLKSESFLDGKDSLGNVVDLFHFIHFVYQTNSLIYSHKKLNHFLCVCVDFAWIVDLCEFLTKLPIQIPGSHFYTFSFCSPVLLLLFSFILFFHIFFLTWIILTYRTQKKRRNKKYFRTKIWWEDKTSKQFEQV